ncbi:MAG: hypothetical protein R3E96_02065 [Planctomycetota bacterium]
MGHKRKSHKKVRFDDDQPRRPKRRDHDQDDYGADYIDYMDYESYEDAEEEEETPAIRRRPGSRRDDSRLDEWDRQLTFDAGGDESSYDDWEDFTEAG